MNRWKMATASPSIPNARRYLTQLKTNPMPTPNTGGVATGCRSILLRPKMHHRTSRPWPGDLLRIIRAGSRSLRRGRGLGERLGHIQMLVQGREGVLGECRAVLVLALGLFLEFLDVLLVVIDHHLGELAIESGAR